MCSSDLCRPWDEVIPNVWIGRKLSNREAEAAVRSGVTAVLDLSAESSEAKAFRVTSYQNIPILDLTAPSLGQLREMAKFIAEHSETGTLLMAAPLHLGTLEAIRTAC